MNPDESPSDHPVSRILKRVSEGEVRAAEELLPLVYEELRRLAAARMKNEAPEHTLQPTALVHEAYLRLLRSEPQSWDNRRHFFSAAAEAMRRILIEHARSRDRLKHGGELHREPLVDIAISPSVDLTEIIAVHEVLEEFEREMPETTQNSSSCATSWAWMKSRPPRHWGSLAQRLRSGGLSRVHGYSRSYRNETLESRTNKKARLEDFESGFVDLTSSVTPDVARTRRREA